MKRPFQHRCRQAGGASVHYRSPEAPRMTIGGTGAKAGLCSCGRVLHREVTPSGYQQLGWGGSYDEMMALLDEEISAKQNALRDAYWSLPRWKRIFKTRPVAA